MNRQGFGTFLYLLAVLMACLAMPAFAQNASKVQEPRFFEVLNDVPLMPGLYEIADEAMVFDKPDGRIAQSAAASQDLPVAEIHAFYAQTLPQMGWQPAGEDIFVRDGEKLTMQTANQDGYSVVRIMVAPR